MSSRAYRLKTEESVADGMRRIAVGRAEMALERLREVDEGELAGAIHGARKDLKKLRGALRLMRGELGRKTFKAENRRYREAGRLLSGSRDAEVKLETLRGLRHGSDDLPEETTRRWERLLEAERDELATAVSEESEGQIAQAIDAIEAGRDAIVGRPLRTDSWALMQPGLVDGYRAGRQAMKTALAEPSAENLHQWRRRAKDLWYQLRIIRDAWPEVLGKTVDQAHKLTEALGDHHDLALLAADLDARDNLRARHAFEVAIEKRQEELLDAALDIGRRLYAEKPKAFGRRIRGYWRAWRGA
jgi:CHAD domain-containing protein